jgi:SAM-dependent methyltransferase
MSEQNPPTHRDSGRSDRQREIAGWFDGIYAERDERYLRPVEAYEVFFELLAAQRDEQVLDIACGPGLLLAQAQRRGLRASGIDISSVAIQSARRRLPTAQLAIASAEAIPFDDGRFDYITCIGSLERFLSPDNALAEMHRLLKPRGQLLIMVRNSRTLDWQLLSRLGLRNDTGHQGADHLEAWRGRLSAAGFHLDSCYPDQWPLMRGQWLRQRLTGSGNFTRVRRGFLPLSLANELIFLCSVRGSG